MGVSNVTTTSAMVTGWFDTTSGRKYLRATVYLNSDCTKLGTELGIKPGGSSFNEALTQFTEDCNNAKTQISAKAEAERLRIQNQTLTSLGQPPATSTTQAEALIQNIGIKANVDESLLRAESQKAQLVSTQADIEGKETKSKLTLFLVIGGVLVVGAIITYFIIKKGKL